MKRYVTFCVKNFTCLSDKKELCFIANKSFMNLFLEEFLPLFVAIT